MRLAPLRPFVAAAALALPATAPLAAQASTDSAGARTVAAIPRAQRPTVAVRAFEFAAMLGPEERQELNSIGALAVALRGGVGRAEDPQLTQTNLARAVTDLLVERLQNVQQFRLLERAQLGEITGEQDLAASGRAARGQAGAQTGALLAARYVVTGSITKFGRSQQRKRGAFGVLSRAVGAGVDASTTQTDYEVAITAKVVEASTGELVASMTTEGKVTGDKGRSIAGIGGTWGGLVGGALSKNVTGEREKRIAEAMQRAVDLIAIQIVEARERGDLVP